MSAAPEAEQMVRAAHILVSEESVADGAVERLKKGDNFGEIAQELSSCPSKDKGGDLGWFGKGQMVPEFERAAYENDPGTLVKVQTQFGWHLVAVLAKASLPREMPVQELAKVLKGEGDTKYQLVDVREEEEVAKASIDGFTNLPMSKYSEWGPKLAPGDERLLDPEMDTIIMCHHGMRSQQVAQHLATNLGFKKTWNVAGGIDAYSREEDTSVPRY